MFDRCRSWRSQLTRRVEGELSPSERALLEDHLAKCPKCRHVQNADDALAGLLFDPARESVVTSAYGFDDSVIAELRAIPLKEEQKGWRGRVKTVSKSLSFEFCMQLAGGGLAAASITAFVLVSALNPNSTHPSLSAYELRTMTALERNRPPVPLESLFQSRNPRAAMMWDIPGHASRPAVPAVQPPAQKPVPVRSHKTAPPKKHGDRPTRRSVA